MPDDTIDQLLNQLLMGALDPLREDIVAYRPAGAVIAIKASLEAAGVTLVTGLPKGTRQVVLAEVEIVAVTIEPLGHIDEREVEREGFPGITPGEFVAMWLDSHGFPRRGQRPELGQRHAMAIECRRIEWRYLDDTEDDKGDVA